MTSSEALFEGPSWRGRLVKLLVALAVVAGASATGYWFFFRPGETAGTATAGTTSEVAVTKGKLVSTLTSTGTAASTVSGKLTFSSSGSVKAVNVAVGDKVTAGQVLATLDDLLKLLLE